MKVRSAHINDALEIQKLVSSLSHFYLEDSDREDLPLKDSYLKNSCLKKKGVLLPLWFAKSLELSEFKQRFASEEFSNFVFVEDSEIVGYISIKNQSHIYHLFVVEKHQGKGVAKELWNHVLSKQSTRNYTVRSSLFAVPVYQSFGFTITEPASSKDGIGFQAMELVR